MAVVAGLVFLSFFAGLVVAADPGVNIGARHEQLNQAAGLVGPGGWVVTMATPGDCSFIEQASNKGVNLVIRGHYPGQNYQSEAGKNWAISWAYTLANAKLGSKVYFMPLNEPNQEGTGDYQTPGTTALYTKALIDNFNQLQIRGSKVYLLSPMLNSNHPNIGGYVNQLPSGFFNQFDGVAMNLYDTEDVPGAVFRYPTGKIPMDNASDFGYVLNNLYRAGGKPVYGVESGVIHHPEGVVYRDEYLVEFVKKAQSARLPAVMAAPFSYDPEHQESWNIFTSDTAKAYRKGGRNPEPVSGGQYGTDDLIKMAKDKGINLVRCGENSCGLATSQEYCTTYAGSFGDASAKRQVVETSDLSYSMTDPVRILQKDRLIPPDPGPRDVTRGTFLEHFNNISLPYVKSTAKYLAGDLIYNSEVTEPSLLSVLMSSNLKDEMMAQYWSNCKNHVYCTGTDSNPQQCPNDADECLVYKDDGLPFHIQDIPRKPLKREYRDLSKYYQDLKAWKLLPLSKYWYQIPIFANPDTVVTDAVEVQACPAFTEVASTVELKVPWVSALKDISAFTKDFLQSHQSLGLSAKPSMSVKLADKDKASPSKLTANQTSTNRQPTKVLADNQRPADSCAALWQQGIMLKQEGNSVCWQLHVQRNNSYPGASNYNMSDWRFRVTVVNNQTGEVFTSKEHFITGGDSNWDRAGGQTIDCHMVGDPNIPLNGVSLQDMSVSWQFIDGSFTGPDQSCNPKHSGLTGMAPGEQTCQVPNPPMTKDDPDPEAIAIEVDGHTRLKGPTKTLKCSWVVDANGEWKCKGDNSLPAYNVDDPFWLYLKIPYLTTIANNLVGQDGLFRILANQKIIPVDWRLAAKADLNYCASVYDQVLRGHFISEGAQPQDLSNFNTSVIDNASLAPYSYTGDSQPYFESEPGRSRNQAQCALGQTTTNLHVYPVAIGGVQQAIDDIAKCQVNPNIDKEFCRQL